MNLGESIFSEMFERNELSENLDVNPIKKSVCPDPDVFFPISCDVLIEVQKNYLTLEKCRLSADSEISPSLNHQFYWNNTVLMRSWNARLSRDENSDDWNVVHQIVVPSKFRQHILSLAHDHLWSGHLGINKTYNRVLQHFFWPGLKADVSRYCKSCHVC